MSKLFSPDVAIINTPAVSVNNFPATQPVSGTVDVGNFPASQTVNGTVNVGNFPGGSVAVATVSRVAVSTTVATLAASNPNRKSLLIHNEQGTLYVKFGSGATSIDYTLLLTQKGLVEITNYTGEVTAIKDNGTTSAQVTEL